MSEIVKKYYNENADSEWQRLLPPYQQVEFTTTMHLIEQYFPKQGHICDIGCGPGRYALELLKRGYKVTLFELSDRELEIAKKNIKEENLKAEAFICENALNLHVLESESYDACLLMGPMYHILNRDDRLHILNQLKRILKKDGMAIIAYLNSWGILKAGVTEFFDETTDFEHMIRLLDEQALDEKMSFTEAYFSTPVKALEEINDAGFEYISYAGAESFLSGISTELTRLYKEQPNVYKDLLEVAKRTCELPQYRDATEHLHVVVRKK